LTPYDEKKLLNKVAEGDQQAFTVLFDAYYQRLGAYVLKVTDSRDATEEIVQEVFIKVWEKREILPTIDSVKAYLFVLSKHRALDYLRMVARKRLQEISLIHEMKEANSLLESSSTTEEYSLIIEKVITELPPQQQRVYQLSRYEKLKYEEIAVLMGISKETVKKHMQCALSFLKKQVKMRIENVGLGVLFLNSVFF
jgi:RNA polymerase sigma-70 factor (ECF subfamily)